MSYWYSAVWRPHRMSKFIEHLINVLSVGIRNIISTLVCLLHAVKKDVRKRYDQLTGVAKPILLSEPLKLIVSLRVYGYIYTLTHLAWLYV